jgi:hypothetical protein
MKAAHVHRNPLLTCFNLFSKPQMNLTTALQICYGLIPYDYETALEVLDIANRYPEEFQNGQAQRGLSFLQSFLSSHE